MIIETRRYLQSIGWLWYILAFMFIVPPIIQAVRIFRAKANSVALVNGYEIKNKDFSRVKQGHENYLRQLASYGFAQFANKMSDYELICLCAQELLEEQVAEKIGVDVGGQELAEELAQGAAQYAIDKQGKFDASRYSLSVASSTGMSVGDYETTVKRKMQTDAVKFLLSNCGYEPKFAADFAKKSNGLNRKLKVFTLSKEHFLEEVKKSDVLESELQDFYQANINKYVSVPSAEVEYVELKPELFSAMAVPDDYDMQDFYEQQLRTRFTEPEKYSINYAWAEIAGNEAQQQELLSQFVEKLQKDDKSFAKLAKSLGLEVETKTNFTVNSNAVPLALEVAVREKTENGEVTRVVEDGNKLYVAQIVDFKPSTVKAYEQVKKEIFEAVQSNKVNQLIREDIENLITLARDEQESGAVIFKDYAHKMSLHTHKATLQQGQKDLGALQQKLLRAALAESSDRGTLSYVVDEGKSYIFLVNRVELPQPQPLEEVRGLVTSDLNALKAQQALVSAGQDLKARLFAGQNSDVDGAEFGCHVATVLVKADDKQVKGFSFNPKVMQSLSGLCNNEQLLEVSTDNEIHLIRLIEMEENSAATKKEAEATGHFSSTVGQDVEEGFASYLIQQAKIETNRKMAVDLNVEF